MPTLRVLELRHAETEPPGAYGAGFGGLADVTTVRVWREPLTVDYDEIDAIVAMGGAMGVADAGKLPWLAAEIEFLRGALDRAIPIWGVCLGSQLLAAALGAEVSLADEPEVGIGRVQIHAAARADPVWAPLADSELSTVQWHFDTFDLPAGATLLASSSSCGHQLFRHGTSYGVQFHLEADGPMVERWLGGGSFETVAGIIGTDAAAGFAEAAARTATVTGPIAEGLMRRWLTRVAGRAAGDDEPIESAAHM